MNLPDAKALQPIALPGATLLFASQWLEAATADALFDDCLVNVPWTVHRIRMFGRLVDSPRRSCWMGDAGATYTYSRARFVPEPWTPALASVRAQLETACSAMAAAVGEARQDRGLEAGDHLAVLGADDQQVAGVGVDLREGLGCKAKVDAVETADGSGFRIGIHGATLAPGWRQVEGCFLFCNAIDCRS